MCLLSRNGGNIALGLRTHLLLRVILCRTFCCWCVYPASGKAELSKVRADERRLYSVDTGPQALAPATQEQALAQGPVPQVDEDHVMQEAEDMDAEGAEALEAASLQDAQVRSICGPDGESMIL